MSSFLNPHLLWGLLLLSAPIIIHLLNKRRFEVHHWAAMDFLLKADVRNRRRLQIEDLLLLLLRAAVIAAAVFLVARPMVEGWGGQEEGERTIVVDDSFSMEHRPTGQSGLERAREAAAYEVQRAIASGARVTVRRGTRPAEEIGSVEGKVAGGELLREDSEGPPGNALPGDPGASPETSSGDTGALSGSRLLAALRTLEASDGALQFAETIEGEVKAIEEDPAGGQRALYLVSDFRRPDWLDPSGGIHPRLREAFARLKKAAGDRLRLRFVVVREAQRENCAVARVAVDTAQPIAGMPLLITVEVRNFGAEERRGLGGELEVGDPSNPSHRIPLPAFPPIPPGGSASVEIEHSFPAPGEYPLGARIDEDRLGRDDRASAVALARDSLSVLIVDGDPGAGGAGDRLSGESGFLAAALAPRSGAPTGIRPQVVPPGLTEELLKGRDVAILLNCASVPAAERDLIDRFARGGGGVAFFLGNKVDAESYRQALGDAGVFPASLRAPVEAVEGVRIDFGAMSHPAFTVYRGLRDASVERITAARYFDLAAGPEAQVVATYADASNTPALLERALGAGRTSLWNLSADRDWTDWPTDPSYPVVLEEWVRHLAPRRGEARSLRVGDAIAWQAGGSDPVVVDPRGGRQQAVLEGTTARLARTELGGLYRVEGQTAGDPSGGNVSGNIAGNISGDPGSGRSRWFAVNRVLEESDLTPASEGDLRRALSGLGVSFSFTEGEESAAADRREGDVWRWLALSAGLLLLGELAAAFWFGRR